MKGYLSVPQAAGLLGWDDSYVRRLARDGRIPGAIRAGRDWLIPDPPVVVSKPRKRARL